MTCNKQDVSLSLLWEHLPRLQQRQRAQMNGGAAALAVKLPVHSLHILAHFIHSATIEINQVHQHIFTGNSLIY